MISFCLFPLSFLSQKIKDFREFLAIAQFYATESMLLWDPKKLRYDDKNTPEYGSDTLEDFYRKVIERNPEDLELADKTLF